MDFKICHHPPLSLSRPPTYSVLRRTTVLRLVPSLAPTFSSVMDDDNSNALRRMSTRTRKVAPKMAAALGSSDNRTQAALARLEALENDNAGIETVEMNDDDEASLDEDDQAYMQKKAKGTKRKTRQAKALENARRAPRSFLELLHEANLESLPPHVPSYLRAAVGPPSSTSRRHFCSVCGFSARYTCVTCALFAALMFSSIDVDLIARSLQQLPLLPKIRLSPLPQPTIPTV
ncbi:hypothetical protein V6N11_009305 [Hibiscus sabdariffa]|uniref:HIT-type domain-containing protein n=1 Tax=Hibiscus sabdariffa TaxID=183260 RepID=A0ABR2PQ90_9ROSI